MSAQKRKRTDFTLKEKKEIIDAAKKEPNQSKLAREISKKWGVEVKRTTVKGILSKKDAIEAAIKAGVPSKRRKLTQAHDPKLDEGVLMWLKQARGQSLPVSGGLIKEKAMKLAELMHIPDFMASDGWLDNFKKRHGITFKTVQGEAGAVDSRSLLEWQQQVLRPLLRQFSADDVFNLVETGLFWQLLPNKTMAFRGEKCTGGKKSKERVTLLVGTNMSGSEKFPLLVIGSSKRPRAFKYKEIPVEYKANSKAWMTAKLFEETLRAWDGRLSQQGRRVLVCLDNFSGHPPDLQLNNIQLVFFPPNTTANSQPMDQGIIENLKRHYKKLLLCRRLEALEEGKEFKFTLLDALHIARHAWEQVGKSTIRNCFVKAKFIEEEIQTEAQDVELLEIWEALPAEEKMHENEEIELSDFLKADESLATGGSFTMEEIAEEMLWSEEPVESEEDEIEEEIVPIEEDQRAWSTVRKVLPQRSGKPDAMQACNRLDNEILRKNMRQPTTLDSFGLTGDSEEELKIGKVKGCKDAAIGDPSHCTPPEHSASTVTTVIEGSSQDVPPKHSALTPASVVKATTTTTAVSPGLSQSNNFAEGDTELVRETASSREGQSDQAESETKASGSDVTLASNQSVGGASNSLENGLVKPARKRGRPPSLHLQKSGSRLPPPASSSPRRQSLRLQRSRGPRPMTPEVARDKMSHRTCQYCGVVKPTPAALCRHIRKHTGERPFVCQVCNKRYKAKRSLHLHQLSHHQELFEHDAALDPSSFASAAVSPSTTNLLRETLETRRLARLTESHDPHSELILDVMALDSDSSPQEMTAYKNGSLQSKCNLVNGESQTSADIEGNMKTAEGEDAEEEESLEDLSKRSCPYCFKVCPKPSDLKRHLMVHTGERPFRCQVCHKCFKQKGSLLYHQKAAHDLNVELSQGLEERYLRLKTRSAMRSLAALDGLNHSGMDGFVPFSHSSQDGLFAAADCSGESLDADSGGKHFPYHFPARHHANSVAGSTILDKYQDFYFQNSKLKNGLLEEEAGQGTKIVEIEILNTKDVKQHRRQRLLVTKQTLLMSRLDGVCLSTGREATVFKCCICGKVFVSLAQTHSHISSHFDLAGMTFDCHLCSAVFMCKSELTEHLQVQHGDEVKVKDNNNDSSGYHHNYYFEEEIAREYQRTRKHFAGFDDHNNNNDKLRDNERAAEPHEEDGDDGDLPLFHSPGIMVGSHEDKGELDDHMRAFPSHCCVVCRKGFTSQYLLQRHMLLHFQQAVTHAGFATAVSTNGLHRDLLTDRLEAVLGLGGTEKEGGEEDGSGGGQEVAKEHEEEKIISHDQTMESDTAKRSQSCRDECPVDLLENEDIRDDVMVVIPSDPDVDNVEMSEFPVVDDDSECPDLASQERETEIRSAPKRSLLPYRTAGPASKSRRKSSLPTRLDYKTRPMATSSCGPPPVSPPSSPLSSSARSPLLSAHVHMGASAEAIDFVPDGHPSSTPSPHLSCPSDEDTWLGRERGSGIKEDSLLAKQTKYVKSLHASYSHAGFLGNGFPSPSPLTVDAGLVGPFASPSLPGQQPVSVQVPTAASTSLLGISSPPSTQTLTNRADEEEQAENLSLSSGNRISPSSPPLSSSHSPASALPSSDEQEGLVGYPRVLWLPSAGSKSNHGSPSPPNLSLTHPSNSSASGKRMQPVWHTLSSDDLRNAPNTDGRKVTSLSRTHSRLYVVNQPVDRERLCKPTILPDGRTVFRCIFCRKDFLSYSDINRHMDFHEDIRPYKCNFCDYYARTNSQLKVHMMRHQGIREFCCKLCNYKGVTQSDLNRHMKSQIHLLKSRNECCRCGEGFVTAKNLEKHVTSICTGKHKMDVEYEAMSREVT